MIAVISDIHGNLWALEAVLAEVDRLRPDEVIVGGDLALGGPKPAECVTLVRRRGYQVIRGNTDEWITHRPAAVTDAISWCADRLSDDDRRFIAARPFLWRQEAPGGDLVVVHATPWSIGDVVRADAPPAHVSRMLKEASAACVVFGHIHTPFVREAPEGLLVNSGSVGLPFDRDWRASFAVVDRRGEDWTATIRRIPYDRDAALRYARTSDNPESSRWSRRVETASF